MIRNVGKYLGILTILLSLAGLLAWATSPDLKFNPASFEDEPLIERIAPLHEAVTLAQYQNESGETVTIQVLGFSGETVTGVKLTELGAVAAKDPFAVWASITANPITTETIGSYPLVGVAMSLLLPSGPSGARHIGVGTNFPEHAEEANSQSVFNFPKFGLATPARTEVRADKGILLDYEVELCMRFDRDIKSSTDFDEAVKGVFLCGDFTNRNAIVNLVDPDNLDSGYGFSDAKSGLNSFPTGPFLVIPQNWQRFVSDVRMTTKVGDEPRQDARGHEMTLDFRHLAGKALSDMSQSRFYYQDKFFLLAENNRINSSSTLMSGTSEGVIFTPPSRRDIIEGMLRYIAKGGPLSEISLIDAVKEKFIENELQSGHFLQPGDVVRHGSNYLGNIEIKVTH